MPRHAKNNTASSVFTYAERQMMDYGTRTQRLGADSLRRITSCALCLQDAATPVLCPKGHLYCKECIFDCIVRQKKEIKERLLSWERQRASDLAAQEESQRSQHEAAVEEFDRQESAILPSSSSSTSSSSTATTPDAAPGTGGGGADSAGADATSALPDGIVCYDTKKGRRYFADEAKRGSMSESEWGALETKAQEMNEKETEDATKKLLSFWVPGVTKEAGESKIKKPSTKTMCPEGDHVLRAKQLISIELTMIRPSSDTSRTTGVATRYQCPACRKEITNATRISALVKCGHVLCSTCIRTLVKVDGQCAVCSKACSGDDIVPVLSGGTGFAAHGEKIEATKITPAARV